MNVVVPAIAIVDVGKTNKKLLVYDQSYNLIHQVIQVIPETVDDDGFPSEDLLQLAELVIKMIDEVFADQRFDVKAINFTAYGASLVYLDENGFPLPILYNYLKPFPEELKNEFYCSYGSSEQIALETASPTLGNLNSGMQLYWVKKKKPEFFKKIQTVLHLPQFISYLFSRHASAEKTSIGCHTQLWNFSLNQYHSWIKSEQFEKLFPPIVDSSASYEIVHNGKEIQVGVGLHDSSSALMPYTTFFKEPFVLISTGTWSISLNPFNQEPLRAEELNQDCLCYMQASGEPVKASRLFLGHFHEMGASRIASHFALPKDFFLALKFDDEKYKQAVYILNQKVYLGFEEVDLMEISSPDLAYHILLVILVEMQIKSTTLIFGHCEPEIILVDGGFSQNDLFLKLLKNRFSPKHVWVSLLSQSTGLGAALVMHKKWNNADIKKTLFPLSEV